MLTHCPGCQTVFRVTSTILRAAHGQVRCGRCNTQFDAVAHLLDQDDPEANNADNASASSTGDNTPQDENFAGMGHEDIILEGHRIEISGIYAQADGSLSEQLEHSEAIAEFNLDSQRWENPFENSFKPEPSLDDPAAVDDQQLTDTASDTANDTEIDNIEEALDGVELAGDIASLENEAVTPSPPKRAPKQAHIAPLPDFLATMAVELKRPPAPWVWPVTAGIATLLLGLQVLHHFRTELARHPSFGPLLMRAYASVGLPLTPHWLLDAYTIKQWGIVSDPQQVATLRLRASITNTADFAQPYPLLRFSLEDRFGVVVGQRDFSPSEYLPGRATADRLLPGKGAANIDLSIVDPGAQAVGFQLDSCLSQAGHIACTHSAVKP